MRQCWTEADQAQAIEMYTVSGMSCREVGDVLGRDRRVVQAHLQAAGITRSNNWGAVSQRPPAADRVKRILEMHESGNSPSRISAATGVSKTTIERVIKEHYFGRSTLPDPR